MTNQSIADTSKKYDINLDFDYELTDNRYRNRRVIREATNEIATQFFKRSRAAGWDPRINIEMHVIERLNDREFPIDEFMQIVAKTVSRYEQTLLDLVESRFNAENPEPMRIQCYGHGAWMVGATIAIHANKYTGGKSYHFCIRTCYKERNAVHRRRTIDSEKIWTRGMPKWLSNPVSERVYNFEEV